MCFLVCTYIFVFMETHYLSLNPLCCIFLNIMSVSAPQRKNHNFVKVTAFGSIKIADFKLHIKSLFWIFWIESLNKNIKVYKKLFSGTEFWKCATRKLMCMTEASHRDCLATRRNKRYVLSWKKKWYHSGCTIIPIRNMLSIELFRCTDIYKSIYLCYCAPLY